MAGRKAANTVHVIGQVRLRQKGKFWHARYTSPIARKEKSLKVTNLKVAMRKAREINEMLEAGSYADLEIRQAATKLTFSKFMEEFKTNFQNWAESTWRGNRSLLTFLDDQFGEHPIGSITTRDIEVYLAKKKDRDDVSTATINRYLATLKVMFKMAVRWGYIGINPADPIKIQKEDEEIPPALTEEELEKLLIELPDYAKIQVIVAAETGMRTGEMQKLMWVDVNFNTREIIVRGSKAKNSEFRVIPMTQKVHALLQMLKKENDEAQYEDLKDWEKEKLTKKEWGKKQFYVLDWKDIKKWLIKAGALAKIGHVHMHMLRHTFATRLRDRGVPLDRIKELLGHKTMAMVLRYAKARPVQLQAAIAALDQPLPKKSNPQMEQVQLNWLKQELNSSKEV